MGPTNLKKFNKNCADFLETKENLLFSSVETAIIDPFLQKMTSKMDEGGYEGLLVNSLIMDQKLVYRFTDDESTDFISVVQSSSLINFIENNNFLSNVREQICSKRICIDLTHFRDYFKDVN